MTKFKSFVQFFSFPSTDRSSCVNVLPMPVGKPRASHQLERGALGTAAEPGRCEVSDEVRMDPLQPSAGVSGECAVVKAR